MFGGGRWIAASIATPVLIAGCIQPFSDEPLDSDGMYHLLNKIVLEPNVDCAELRDKFGAHGLPIVSTPAELPMAYSEAYVRTLDENALRAWYLPAQLDRGIVLVSYGAVGSMPCYLYTARILVANGWSVVMY